MPNTFHTFPRATRDLEISVIVPTLNEAVNLPVLLDGIDDALRGRSYEVILVDDNSTDGTPAVVEEMADKFPVRLFVRRTPLNGLSGAVLHGMAAARGDKLIVMDADLQHPPQAIPALIARLDRGDAEFVIGSRYITGASTGESWSQLRRWNSILATWLARPFAGKTRDPMSGFFALHRETYRCAKQLNPLGYKIALELICKCRVRRVAEVPIHFGPRVAGESKLCFREQTRYLRHLARLYAFTFPRTAMFCRAVFGAAAGYEWGLFTGSSLTLFMGILLAMTFAIMDGPPVAISNRRKSPMGESVYRLDESSSLRKAA